MDGKFWASKLKSTDHMQIDLVATIDNAQWAHEANGAM